MLIMPVHCTNTHTHLQLSLTIYRQTSISVQKFRREQLLKREDLPCLVLSSLIFQLPTIAIYRLRLLVTLPLSLRSLLTTAAIVEIADLGTVELLLLQPLVDLVVDEAGPAGGRVARADLRRVLG